MRITVQMRRLATNEALCAAPRPWRGTTAENPFANATTVPSKDPSEVLAEEPRTPAARAFRNQTSMSLESLKRAVASLAKEPNRA